MDSFQAHNQVRTLLSQLEDIMGNLEDCCKSGGLNNSALLRGALLESIYKQRPLFKHIRAAIHAADQLELTLAEEQRLEQMQALVEECRTLAAKLEKLQKQMDDLQAEIAAGEAESSALGSLLQDLQQQTSQAEAQYEIVQKQAALDADAAAAAIIAASSELCHLVVDRVMKAAAFARLQAAQLAGEAPAHDKAPIAEQGWEVMTQKLSLIVSGSAAPKDAAAANWRDVLLAGYLQVHQLCMLPPAAQAAALPGAAAGLLKTQRWQFFSSIGYYRSTGRDCPLDVVMDVVAARRKAELLELAIQSMQCDYDAYLDDLIKKYTGDVGDIWNFVNCQIK